MVSIILQEQKATLKLPSKSPIRAKSPILASNKFISKFPTSRSSIGVTVLLGQRSPRCGRYRRRETNHRPSVLPLEISRPLFDHRLPQPSLILNLIYPNQLGNSKCFHVRDTTAAQAGSAKLIPSCTFPLQGLVPLGKCCCLSQGGFRGNETWKQLYFPPNPAPWAPSPSHAENSTDVHVVYGRSEGMGPGHEVA